MVMRSDVSFCQRRQVPGLPRLVVHSLTPSDQVLRLRSRRAAVMAFSFAQDGAVTRDGAVPPKGAGREEERIPCGCAVWFDMNLARWRFVRDFCWSISSGAGGGLCGKIGWSISSGVGHV